MVNRAVLLPGQLPQFGTDLDLVSMVLWLPINEGAGSRLNNLIDSQNPGRMTGGAWSGGKPVLDGTDDLIALNRVRGLVGWTVLIRYTPAGVSGTSPIFDQGDILIRQSEANIIYGMTDDAYSDSTDTLAAALTAGTPIDIAVSRSGDVITILGYTSAGVATSSFTASGTPLTSLANLIIGADSREDFVFPLMADITNLSTDRALVIAASDDLRFSAGSASLNSVVVAENWNGNQLTILIWVNLNFAPGDGLTHQLLANNVGGGSNNISVFIFTDGTLYYDVTDKDVLLHRFSSSITGWSVGTWHQVAVRLDFGNDEGELYVDGVSVDSTPTNPFSNDSMDTIAVTNLGQDSAQANQINGQISILAENRSWSDAEITADYAAGAGTPRVVGPYTILYDQFSDSLTGITFHPSGQGVTATDSGGNVTLDVTDAEKLYVVGEDASLEDATGFSASGPVLIESASGADVTVGSGIAHADLNGTSQFFSVSDAAFPATGLTGAQDLTIEFRIKPGADSGNQGIASKYAGSGDKRMYRLLRVDDELRFQVSSDGTSGNTSTANTAAANLVVGEWIHGAVVYDASAGTVDFYLGGVFLEQIGSQKTSIADKAPDFEIGANDGGNFYTGSLAYVHLFSDIRTPAEIYADSRDFDADLSGEGNLVCGYKFTEAGAATEIDNVEGTAAGDIIPQDSGAVTFSGLRSTEGSYVQDVERVGISLEFDGSSDYVDCGTDASLDISGNITICGWISTTQSFPKIGNILTKWDPGNNDKAYRLSINLDASKVILRLSANGSTNSIDAISTSDINDGNLHHVAGIYDGSNAIIYVDGIAEHSPAYAGGIFSVIAEPVLIGAETAGDIGNYFDGQLSEVQLFNIPLTAADTLWLATHPGADEAEIVANTSVNLGQMVLHHDYRNRNLIDVSSDGAGNLNGNDGTHSGTPSFVTTAHLTRNKWVDGSQENGGEGGRVVGSNSVVTKDTSVVKFDGQSEKHVWTAADNNDEDTVATMALVSGNDYSYRFWLYVSAIDGSSNLFLDIDGSATPIHTRQLDTGTDDMGTSYATGTWLYFEGAFQADQVAITVKLRITGAGAGANSATVYIDQCEVLEQLVVNPGMEGTYNTTGTLDIAPGWINFNMDTGVDSASKETTIVHSGSASQKIEVDASNEGVQNPSSGAALGDYLTLSAWVYVETGVAELVLFQSAGEPLFNAQSTTTGEWELLRLTYLSADTTPLIILRSVGPTTCYFDDVTLTRVDQRDANTATRTRDFADGKVDGMAVWSRGMNAIEIQRKRDFVFGGSK